MFILLQVAWFHSIYLMVIIKVWQNEKNYPIRKRKGITVLIQWMTNGGNFESIPDFFFFFSKCLSWQNHCFFLPVFPPSSPSFLPHSLFFSRFTSFVNLQQGLFVVRKKSTELKQSEDSGFETQGPLIMNDLEWSFKLVEYPWGLSPSHGYGTNTRRLSRLLNVTHW